MPGAARNRTNKRALSVLVNSHDLFEKFWRERHAERAEPLEKTRRSGCASKTSEHASVFTDAGLLEDENVLHLNLEVAHAGDFGNVRHFARAVAEPRRLYQQMDD